MELKDICVDLEIAKELKEKGFNQPAFFCYYAGDKKLLGLCTPHTKIMDSDVRTYTAEELLKELPVRITIKKRLYLLSIVKGTDDNYYISYNVIPNGNSLKCDKITKELFFDEKLCNALGKMYKYLKDNKLIK